ncbi:MAG: TIGR03960 family B12-binding radical SAM protein [Planctomycetota bacterium]
MDDVLARVERPSRYLGNELNAVKKDLRTVELKVGLAYPDLYEIGMSNTGLHILYYMLNEDPTVAAERVYLPAQDMEQLLRDEGRPLTTLENKLPLRELDVLGIQIPHELSFTNIVKTLRLGGVSAWTAERGDREPLVLAGGPGVFGAEPVAPFYDAMLLGDAEEALWEILGVVRRWRAENWTRARLHEALAQLTGVYVPSLYRDSYNADGTLAAVTRIEGTEAPELVHKAVVKDLESAYYPETAIVPYAETVHNRLGVEVMRGCTVGCRFCQAGMIYRPVRERSPQRIVDLAKCGLGATGYKDLSLLSLDTGDYTLIDPLTKELLDETADKRVAISLPSLRAGSLTDDVIRDIQRVRRTSFTIAPEAGTQRLRDVINKNISDEEIYETVERVAKNGWKGIKLYFMIGFPTETDADLDGLVDLVARCRDLGQKHTRGFMTTASVGTLVPKPQTPFQWDAQISAAESERRISTLARRFKELRISFKYHNRWHSWMEGVFSRGDRRLAAAIADAEARGAGFESWQDRLDLDLWHEVFADHGVDPEWYLRRRDYEEALPWDHLSARVTKKFLLGDRKKVDRMQEPITFDCRDDLCAGCSCCFSDDVRNRLAKYDPEPFADGRKLPVALTSRIAMGHGVAQQVSRDPAAKSGDAAAAAQLRRRRRPAKPSPRRWAVTPGSPGLEGPAPAFLEAPAPATPEDLTFAIEGEGAPAPFELPGKHDLGPRELFQYRVTYARRGELRWLSHRETMRAVYRLVVRTELPLVFTQGYHPKPKLAFGPPLPTGCASEHEELDLFLLEPREPAEIVAALQATMPPDLVAKTATRVVGRKTCHAERQGARWAIELASLDVSEAAADAAVARWAACEAWPLTIERKKRGLRHLDLKTLLGELEVEGGELRFDLDQRGATAKPSEVAAELLGVDPQRALSGRYTLLEVRSEPIYRTKAMAAAAAEQA